MDLNLDDLRAKTGKKQQTVTVGGRTFTMPAVFSVAVTEAKSQEEAVRALFGVTDEDDVKHLLTNLSMVRSDVEEFDPDEPSTDFDLIAEKVYGIVPNREARRAGKKDKTGK